MSYALRTRNTDGTMNETAITAEQAATLAAGRAIAYTARDERIVVDHDARVIKRASAIPRKRNAA